MKNEIILYRPNELAEHIEVRLDDNKTGGRFICLVLSPLLNHTTRLEAGAF